MRNANSITTRAASLKPVCSLFAVMIGLTFAGSTYAAEEKKMDAPAAAPAAPAAPAATPAVGGEMKKEEKKAEKKVKKAKKAKEEKKEEKK